MTHLTYHTPHSDILNKVLSDSGNVQSCIAMCRMWAVKKRKKKWAETVAGIPRQCQMLPYRTLGPDLGTMTALGGSKFLKGHETSHQTIIAQ